jgi:TolA-binding protein
LGDLAEARAGFTALTRERLPEEAQEEARYYLGLIAFFEKQYDSASLEMSRLMIDFPRGYYVNDAISLSMVMSAAENSTEALDPFAEALLYQTRGIPDSTRTRLQAVADQPGGRLADIALYELARLELGLGDSTATLTAVDHLITDHPDSYYVPMGMKIKADICAGQFARRQEAREIYLQLLEGYPDYPMATEVRQRLRSLEAQLSVG